MTAHPFLSPALALPALLYEGAVRLRNEFYNRGLFLVHDLPRPVISVGNITVGGTGKTPLVMHIAQLLSHWGLDPVLLSRGYKRRSGGSPIVVAPRQIPPPSPQEVGDEPALIQRRNPSVWLAISKDRSRAARQLTPQVPKAVFLLDDGFQHRRLVRDLDIVLVDASQPLGSNHAIPWGTLREPLSSLKRADLVMCNGVPDASAATPVEAQISRIHPDAAVFHCLQEIDRIVSFDHWPATEAQDLTPGIRGAMLVAAIAQPGRFQRDVLARGIPVCGRRWYRDHHWFTTADLRLCAEAARSAEADILLITEKDAARLSVVPEFPVAVAVQRTTILEAEDFERLLRRVCQRDR